MSLVKAKCPNCGQLVEIDEKDFLVTCKFCGVPFMPQEGIDNYNNYLAQMANNLDIDTINVNTNDISNYATLGLAALKEKNHEKCGFYADDILKRNPNSPEGLLLRAFFASNNYSVEEGIRSYFLAYENSDNDELRKLIISTLENDFQKYKTENFAYLFDQLLNYQEKIFSSVFKYALTYISTSLNEIILSELKLNLNQVLSYFDAKETIKFDMKGSKIIFIDDLLIEVVDGVINNAISLSLVSKNIDKYCSKKTQYQVTYNFYMLQDNDEDRIFELKLLEPNDELENELKKHFEIKEIKAGCYIATCVYGSYNNENLWVLRRFRDFGLKKSIFGRLFIKLYYFISPILVKMLKNNSFFVKSNRYILNKFVNVLKNKGYSSKPYRDE